MAMRPLAAALGSAAGTLVALGGTTLLVTSVALGAVKTVVKRRQKIHAKPCIICKGQKTTPCQVCKGRAVLDWQPFADPMTARVCLCPGCKGCKQSKCLNCLGEGETY